MTTDPFTEAAREEACRYHWELREGGDLYYPPLDFGQHMAEWARTHLAAQEPPEDEVLAAAWAICRLQDDGYEPTEDHPCGACTESARAALSAARAARRDEEKRNG